jgi:hypothetical protein
MNGNRWTEEDEAMLALEALPGDEPIKLTIAVWNALTADADHRELVRGVVTPESAESWGDFSQLAAALDDENLGIVSKVRQEPGTTDVAVVWLLRDPGPARMMRGAEFANIAFMFTWVWRPELGGWRLHEVGTRWVPTSELPRTSPGDAPALDAVPPSFR